MLAFALLGLLGIGLVVNLLDDGDEDSFDTNDGELAQGSGGDDLIETGGGDDSVFAGAGDDVILTGDGDDRAFGGAGDDLIVGEADDDFLRGGAGDDLIFGGAGEDELNGDVGDDVIVGADIIDARGIVEATETSIQTGDPLTEDQLNAFIDLRADTGEADTLNGGVGSDVMIAGNNDVVDTGAGEDIVNLGQWVAPGAPVQITGFNPFQDDIVYTYEGGTEPDVSFGEDDNGTATLTVDGEIVAYFENADFFDLVAGSSIVLERLG
jgi:Ca2+-binding RTX toxin-like protein